MPDTATLISHFHLKLDGTNVSEEFMRALEIEPNYPFARAALAAIGKQLN